MSARTARKHTRVRAAAATPSRISGVSARDRALASPLPFAGEGPDRTWRIYEIWKLHFEMKRARAEPQPAALAIVPSPEAVR
ncbi:MAG TPA: hypothetical protein VHI99_26970 [Vicinamibacterales bacterium]|nr:hypothetical protein [Vicinamibacterales bacterium]